MKQIAKERVMLSRKSKDLQTLCNEYAANPELRNELLCNESSTNLSTAKTSEVCTFVAVCVAAALFGVIAGIAASVASVAATAVAVVTHVSVHGSEQLEYAMINTVTYRNIV